MVGEGGDQVRVVRENRVGLGFDLEERFDGVGLGGFGSGVRVSWFFSFVAAAASSMAAGGERKRGASCLRKKIRKRIL